MSKVNNIGIKINKNKLICFNFKFNKKLKIKIKKLNFIKLNDFRKESYENDIILFKNNNFKLIKILKKNEITDN